MGKKTKGKGSKRKSGGGGGRSYPPEREAGELQFEDPYEDEFEEEEYEDEEEQAIAAGAEVMTRVWRPGVDELKEGEELEHDPTAYHMFHRMKSEWPCLSFDFIRDGLGVNRTRFPHTVTLVAGTQAAKASENKLQLMRLSQLHRTSRAGLAENDDEEDDDDDDMDDEDEDPVLDHISIKHPGGVNRVRAMGQRPGIVASWSDSPAVHIWDLRSNLSALEKGGPRNTKVVPVETVRSHTKEGYALDWSNAEEGSLLSGDCASAIHLTKAVEGGWESAGERFCGHKSSVEDIQWSPTEATVFCSGSADRTVAVWDTRKKKAPMLSITAHEEDVNVISWNPNVTYLLASGSDDGSFKIWDLRTFSKGKAPEPVAQFNWHKAPITSLEWHGTDESMIAVSGADNQLSVWDLSVEADESEPTYKGLEELPPQLLFLHQGQQDVKELHYHPQIPGAVMSTAADGFNIFIPATTVAA